MHGRPTKRWAGQVAVLAIGMSIATVSPAATASGTAIAFGGSDGEIWSVQLDGTGLTNLTQDPGWDRDPSYSPDGSTIVFASDRLGVGLDLWLMDRDGSEPRLLLDSPVQDWNPSWSPDGDRIVFTRQTEEGDLEVFDLRIKTGEVRNLSKSPTLDAQPSYTPDGDGVVFMRDYDIWAMTDQGREQTQLTFDGAVNEWPHVSPSGQRIVFHAQKDDGWYDVYSMRIDGTGLRRLTVDEGPDAWPVFGPTGAIAWQRYGILHTMPASGSNERAIDLAGEAYADTLDWG